MPAYVQHDLALRYFAPWSATIQLGVRNATNRDPSLSSLDGQLGGDLMNLYPLEGRVPFLFYTQIF